jgi:hypothetical protein
VATVLFLDWQLDQPDKPEGYVAHGNYLLKRNRAGEALALADQFLKRQPKDAQIQRLRDEAKKRLP